MRVSYSGVVPSLDMRVHVCQMDTTTYHSYQVVVTPLHERYAAVSQMDTTGITIEDAATCSLCLPWAATDIRQRIRSMRIKFPQADVSWHHPYCTVVPSIRTCHHHGLGSNVSVPNCHKFVCCPTVPLNHASWNRPYSLVELRFWKSTSPKARFSPTLHLHGIYQREDVRAWLKQA
jgi:hypothetical protein